MATAALSLFRLTSSRNVLPLFAATVFLSAGLMFLVEPMVAKMVLPRLGGSPFVWTTCLVFFQAMLLIGYAYAHALTRMAQRGRQVFIHLGIMLLAALTLPLGLGADAPPAGELPSWWLLMRLTLTAGPAVFVISATAPLLQSWFSALDVGAVGDPYFLYAGSNAGSLLALLTYPLLFEPAFELDKQALLWSAGFSALIISVALCAVPTLLRAKPALPSAPQADPTQSRLLERLRWTALAMAPSSLLLGVTTHITTDIVSAPLLWVVPLAAYLLSFIVAFARRSPVPHAAAVRVMPIVLIPLITTMAPGMQTALPFQLFLPVGALFVIALVCHGELARLRPPPARLTDFYFFVSLGGVLGGAFNALLAPAIFPDLWEYPIALVAACLLKPETQESGRGGWAGDIALPLMLFATVALVRRIFGGAGEGSHLPPSEAVFGVILPGLALLNFSSRRWRFAGGVAACLLAASLTGGGDAIVSARSFFGVSRVRVVSDEGHRFMVLMHGTTMHGVESLAPGEETLPLAYYSREGTFGIFFAALPASAHRVGVIGLGAGGLACYATPGQAWTFYEIDPLVERLARNQNYFHFLADCGNHPTVVLGDARLTISDAPDGFYDVLVLDAFSSDSIPMHLVTREALNLYVRKLAPGGRMLFHISSNMIDLHEVIGSLAADAGLTARLSVDSPPAATTVFRRSPTIVVAVARSAGDLGGLDQASGWLPLPAGSAQFLWTDQKSDLLHVIRFRMW